MKSDNTDESRTVKELKADPIQELINTEITRLEWDITYHDKKARESRERLESLKAGLTKHLKSWAI